MSYSACIADLRACCALIDLPAIRVDANTYRASRPRCRSRMTNTGAASGIPEVPAALVPGTGNRPHATVKVELGPLGAEHVSDACGRECQRADRVADRAGGQAA